MRPEPFALPPTPPAATRHPALSACLLRTVGVGPPAGVCDRLRWFAPRHRGAGLLRPPLARPAARGRVQVSNWQLAAPCLHLCPTAPVQSWLGVRSVVLKGGGWRAEGGAGGGGKLARCPCESCIFGHAVILIEPLCSEPADGAASEQGSGEVGEAVYRSGDLEGSFELKGHTEPVSGVQLTPDHVSSRV